MATFNLWNILSGNPDPPSQPGDGWYLINVSFNNYPFTVTHQGVNYTVNGVGDLPVSFPQGSYNQDFTIDTADFYTFEYIVSNAECTELQTSIININIYDPEICVSPTNYSCNSTSNFVHPVANSFPRSGTPLNFHIPSFAGYASYNVESGPGQGEGYGSDLSFDIIAYRYLTNAAPPQCGITNEVLEPQSITFSNALGIMNFVTGYNSFGNPLLPSLNSGDRIIEIRLFNNATNNWFDVTIDDESGPAFNPGSPNTYANYIKNQLSTQLGNLGFFAFTNYYLAEVLINSSGDYNIFFGVNDVSPGFAWIGVNASYVGSPPTNAVKLKQGGNTNNYINVSGSQFNGPPLFSIDTPSMAFPECSQGISLLFDLANLHTDINTYSVSSSVTSSSKLATTFPNTWFADPAGQVGIQVNYNGFAACNGCQYKEVYFNDINYGIPIPNTNCIETINTYTATLNPIAQCPNPGGVGWSWFLDGSPVGLPGVPSITSEGPGTYSVSVSTGAGIDCTATYVEV